MNGFFDRIGGFFRRDNAPETPNDTDPPGMSGDQSAICMAALVIGVLMIVRR